MKKISVGCLEIGEEEKGLINQVLDSGRISEGQKTHEFEQRWSEYIGTKYCVAVSSGTGALITALTALKYLHKLEQRPKVITSPLTYISVANAIVLCGFEPVFVDIDRHSFCITPEAIEQHLEEDASGYSIILPVDLMGYSLEMDQIKRIAKKFNLFVLEDAAEAHGTTYRGKRCGANADAGIFSFYIAHNVQAGEMGAITTNNHDIYRLAKKIKANGRICECEICTRQNGHCPVLGAYQGDDDFDPRFLHDLVGYNFKTMEFQSAIALTQLAKIEQIIKKRRENVQALNNGLKEFSSILQLPIYDEQVSYLAYPIVINKPEVVLRKILRQELEKKGIETRVLFGCIPTQQPAYAHLKDLYKDKLTQAEYVGRNGFYIGCHQYIGQEEIDYIISCFKEIIGARMHG
jgi:CDP-6-deoxy-D-xylo-4-hexulose-3-dehydrase